MNIAIKYPVALASVFLWIGFVGAISFMEAWLKFRAPGVTLPLGLGIGRLVFQALNRVELVLSLTIIVSMIYTGISSFKMSYLLFIIPFLIVILQTFYLLPTLDLRAEMHILGQTPPPSNLHFYYVGLEFIKVISLLLFGIKIFRI